MSFIKCLECKIKYREFHNLCKNYKLKDKVKENFNEECILEVLDKEVSKIIDDNIQDFLISFTSIDDFDLKNSKEYKIGD